MMRRELTAHFRHAATFLASPNIDAVLASILAPPSSGDAGISSNFFSANSVSNVSWL